MKTITHFDYFYEIGDRVILDNNKDIKGTVIGVNGTDRYIIRLDNKKTQTFNGMSIKGALVVLDGENRIQLLEDKNEMG